MKMFSNLFSKCYTTVIFLLKLILRRKFNRDERMKETTFILRKFAKTFIFYDSNLKERGFRGQGLWGTAPFYSK